MKAPWRWLPLLVLCGLVAAGWLRLRFDAEVLNLLPGDLPAVRALEWQQQFFPSGDETPIALDAPDAGLARAAAESLTGWLQREDAVAAVEWRPPLLDDPSALAELIAWQWIHQPPEVFGQLADRLSPDNASRRFEEVRDRLAVTFSPGEIGRLSRDPFGLMQIPGQPAGGASMNLETAGYVSADGNFRVLHAWPARKLDDFRACHEWVQSLKQFLEEWRAAHPEFAKVATGVTGRPAFVAETAIGMEADMKRAAPVTAALIAVLFWVAHRRWRPMLWLLGMLGLVLALTLAAGGLAFGSLNAVSLGFAAILLGVTADYALVLFQEWRANPGSGLGGVRAGAGRGVVWSALTTAAAFGSLTLGSLPGLAQLGALVAFGVLLGAAIMLFVFLPLAVRGEIAGRVDAPEWRPSTGGFVPGPFAKAAAVLGTVTVVMVLLVKGMPGLNVSVDPLRPVDSEAHATAEEIGKRLDGRGHPWMVIGAATDEASLQRQLQETRSILDARRESGAVREFVLPDTLLPHPGHRLANAANAARLADRLPDLRRLAAEAGFNEDATRLTEGVFKAFQDLQADEFQPRSPVVRRMLDQVFAYGDGRVMAMGLVHPGKLSSAGTDALARQLTFRAGDRETVVAAWELLGRQVLERERADLVRVLVVMTVLVLAVLWLAFRSVAEVAFCLVAVVLSGLGLLAVMAAMGWSWNLLNLMVAPLLLGLAVDYSIHIRMALRRHGGRLSEAWHTTGRALVLCAATTAVGFGSLTFSGNSGLVELGRLCATGVVMACCFSVWLLPVWWPLPVDGDAAASVPPDGPSHAYGARAWRLGLRVAGWLPAGVLLPLGRLAGRTYAGWCPERRLVVERNLLPLVDDDSARAREAADRLFGHFGEKIVELWRYEGGVSFGEVDADESTWRALARAKEGGRGVLLVTVHLGNWELGSPLLTRRGEKLLVLSLPEPGAGFSDIRRTGRAHWGVDTLIVSEDPLAFLEVIRRLGEGSLVALLMDRPAEKNRARIELFGRPFDAPIGAAELARASGCAILPVAIVRAGSRHRLHLLPEVEYDRARLRSREARVALTGKIVRAFEPLLRKHPDQWYHFVPIWPPDDGADDSRTPKHG